MTRHSFLSPEERSEKRFVPSTSLPREKQARATLQRSEAKRRDACPRKTMRDEQKKRNPSR